MPSGASTAPVLVNGSGISFTETRTENDPISPKIGDRVEIVPGWGPDAVKDLVGIVRQVKGYGDIGVEFEGSGPGHNLEGEINTNRGWWVPKYAIRKIVEGTKKYFGKINSPKLESLPADLRKLADEVLAEKFG